jgi:hypothetical protein
MAHELHALLTAILPPTCAVCLTEVTIEKASVRLQLTETAPTAACPRCAVPSSAIHSRYQRHPTDLPWGKARCSPPADGAEIRVPEGHLHAPYLHGAPAGLGRPVRPQNPAVHHGSSGDRHGRRRAGGGPARRPSGGTGQCGHLVPPGTGAPIPSTSALPHLFRASLPPHRQRCVFPCQSGGNRYNALSPRRSLQ